ncbi:MAG: hypothetical protein ACYC9O_17215 [Candidatus Latescibacterota bacterium]
MPRYIPGTVFLLCLLASGAAASLAQQVNRHWKFDQETGVVFSGYNDVRIPGNAGTLFSFSKNLDTDSKLFYRLKISYTFFNGHTVAGAYAPLTLGAFGVFAEPVRFQGIIFPADSLINGEYQFSSYRLTYRYEFLRSKNWEVGAGVTGLIRNAAIRLQGGGLFAEKKNTGVVPLLHFRALRRLDWSTSILFEGDALASTMGRAEDVLFAVQYLPVTNFRLQFGYRILEGGADNDEVYNFALLHYAVAGAILEF